eukprot:TRINITY_DN2574_c0_g1_i1.p1 TRINITY_DN2574_c0_g1~~TRINITY_DN2574_c0_g1_i1.p1  ORF type:complete len:177 (-),score=39.53 TRINITY_DN2574_c0_g1_i1:72-602(-)
MGMFFSMILDWSSVKRNLVMLGLDAAGKTTILYRLKLGEVSHTVPTIGFNVEKVHYNNLEMTVWDVGGQKKLRPLWKHYLQKADALIFVIDSVDKERIGEAKEELQDLIAQEELSQAAILIFANKTDVAGALPASEVAQQVGILNEKQRKWKVQASNALTGAGLYEGLHWLNNILG